MSVSVVLSSSEAARGLDIEDISTSAGRGNMRPSHTSTTTALQLDTYLQTARKFDRNSKEI